MAILETRTFIEEYTEQVPKGATHYTGELEGLKTFYKVIEVPAENEIHVFKWDSTNNGWVYVNDLDLRKLKYIKFADIEAPVASVANSNAKIRRRVSYDSPVCLPEGATHYIVQWDYMPLIIKRIPPSRMYSYEQYFSWNIPFKKWVEWSPHIEDLKHMKEIVYVEQTVKEEGQR